MCPTGARPKVHPDHHVQVLKALYSVPTRYIGKTLDARADRKTVRLYCGAELIKVHPRKAAGQRATDVKDFPPGKAAVGSARRGHSPAQGARLWCQGRCLCRSAARRPGAVAQTAAGVWAFAFVRALRP